MSNSKYIKILCQYVYDKYMATKSLLRITRIYDKKHHVMVKNHCLTQGWFLSTSMYFIVKIYIFTNICQEQML